MAGGQGSPLALAYREFNPPFLALGMSILCLNPILLDTFHN